MGKLPREGWWAAPLRALLLHVKSPMVFKEKYTEVNLVPKQGYKQHLHIQEMLSRASSVV